MKYKAVDLFCGAGGLSSGLKKGGFDVALGIDIDTAALKTYKNNIKRAKVLNKDIKLVSGKEITELTGIKKGDCFLLAGCPPCQGFSNLGKRDEKDVQNKLVYEYIRLIYELEPCFILMENVPGMSRGVGKEIFKDVVVKLEEKYHIQYDTLNAADYGVPQIRKRLVLHGVRKDVYDVLTGILNTKELPLLPEATYSKEKKKGFKRWRTVQETIMDLPEIQAGEDAKNVNIANHVARKLSKTNQNRLDNIRKNGGDRRSVSAELQLECHKKENVSYTDTYGVISLDRPAPTITSGCTIISTGRYGHPTQNRGLSVREAARLQSFDDKFIFVGNIGEMSLQIGNAVPPKLAQASAKEIIKYMKLFEENTKEDDNREVITI